MKRFFLLLVALIFILGVTPAMAKTAWTVGKITTPQEIKQAYIDYGDAYLSAFGDGDVIDQVKALDVFKSLKSNDVVFVAMEEENAFYHVSVSGISVRRWINENDFASIVQQSLNEIKNAGGTAYILMPVVLPETGDGTNPALLGAVMVLGAGLLVITMKRRRSA